jgi:hypothetical protein
MIFKEIDKSEIYTNHNNSYRDDATYYSIFKDDKYLCTYGILSRSENIGEAFWIVNSFNGKVFCKSFFYYLFKHASSLKYKEIYTWTRCERLINVFGKFGGFGIERVAPPEWDNDPSKTWFMKRI